MSEFFRESQDLNPRDQTLLQLYAATGCSIDSLPYTAEFEELVAKLRATGDGRSKSEILKKLLTLRKAGKLPRLTTAPVSERDSDSLRKPTEEPQGHRAPFGSSSGEGDRRRPVSGMNSNYRSESSEAPAYTLITAGYFDSVTRAGGIPIVIPPLPEESAVNDVLDLLDGIVLVGGADLDPRRDGFMAHPSMRLLDERRETFDRMLVLLVATRKLPVLGIGSGMQLLNVSQGGNLHLHVPDDLPQALPHSDVMDRQHRHPLLVEADSTMGRVYGEGEIRVNSSHHMAVDEVAPGFRITARAPDGVVEAIESEDQSWFAVGTQFHPQSSSASSLDLRIFEELVLACEERAIVLGQGVVE